MAERWAVLVLRASESAGDLKTVAAWARFVGLSYTSLAEACRLIGIRPRDARDLARILRTIIRCRRDGEPIEALLDVADTRTLKALLARAGLGSWRQVGSTSTPEFLDRQQFVPTDNSGMRVLRRLVTSILEAPS